MGYDDDRLYFTQDSKLKLLKAQNWSDHPENDYGEVVQEDIAEAVLIEQAPEELGRPIHHIRESLMQPLLNARYSQYRLYVFPKKTEAPERQSERKAILDALKPHMQDLTEHH